MRELGGLGERRQRAGRGVLDGNEYAFDSAHGSPGSLGLRLQKGRDRFHLCEAQILRDTVHDRHLAHVALE